MWNYILFSLFICAGSYMYYNKENIVTVINIVNDDKNMIAFNMIFKGIKINKYKIYDDYISNISSRRYICLTLPGREMRLM